MKKTIAYVSILFVIVYLPFILLAQDIGSVVSDADTAKNILSLFTSENLKGLGAVITAVQVLMALLRSEYVSTKVLAAKGPLRLLILSVLTCVCGALNLILQGMSPVSALVYSLSAASFQVFAHQLYTYFFEAKKR